MYRNICILTIWLLSGFVSNIKWFFWALEDILIAVTVVVLFGCMGGY